MLVDILPLHDALIVFIGLEETELNLGFEVDGQRHLLKIEGLAGLYAGAFLAGNIVLSASVYSLPLTDEDIVTTQMLIEKYSEYYKSPLLPSATGSAFVIESSYGAELIAVFNGCIAGPALPA